MYTVDELLAAAQELTIDERRQLIELLTTTLHEPDSPPAYGWTRDLWEETPEYRVGVAQAISVAEVQRRLKSHSWLKGLFE
jgi:hypothetical protein